MILRFVVRTVAWVVSFGALGVVSSGVCRAQVAIDESPALEGVVVTAERRERTVQDSALAITAVQGDALAERGNTLAGLHTLVPNLTFGEYAGNAQIAIRGISFNTTSPGAEARTAVYEDGIYWSRPSAALANVFDVERIEVLRGPQGTLYGRNATGGAINIVSRDPGEAAEGFGRMTFGSYGLVQFEGAMGGALAEGLSARVAFQTQDHDGYGENLDTGQEVGAEHNRAIRGKLLIEPTSALTIKLATGYSRRQSNYARANFGRGNPDVPTADELLGQPATLDRDHRGLQPINELQAQFVSAEANYDIGNELQLISLSGYRSSEILDAFGYPSIRQYRKETSDQHSQEFRLTGELGRLSFVGGIFYYREKVAGDVLSNLRVPTIAQGAWVYGVGSGGEVDTEAAAVFGQVEVALADRLTLTAGGRYSSESKSVAEYNGTVLQPYEGSIYDGPTRSFPRFSGKRRWTSFDPKVTLAFNASEALMFYGTYASGFQSGGFNVGGRQPPFSPEELDDYEAGLKWELFDRRLQINLAGFYYDYQNLQVQRTINNQTQVDNAASSTVRGVEAELRARPADHIEVGLNVALLDAEFDQYLTSEAAYPALGVYSLAGNTLPQAPREAVTLDGAYTLALGNGALRLRGDVSFKSKIYFSQFNREQVAQGAYTLANADLTYTAAGDWFVSLYGRNLTNERYRVSASGGTALLGFAISGAFGPPRTVGVTLGRDF